MDYDNLQFIDAVKKVLGTELLQQLRCIQDTTQGLIEAVSKAANAHDERQQPPSVLRAELKVPQSEHHKNETNAARQLIDSKLLIYIQVFGLLAIVAYTTVAAYQLDEMRKATKASTEASMTAARALAENTRQFDMSFGELLAQTSAQQWAAKASQNAATTAADALHISERAYVTVGNPQLDIAKKTITMTISNNGRIPSGKADVVAHAFVVVATEPNSQGMASVIEKYWRGFHYQTITPGIPLSIHQSFKQIDAGSFTGGLQHIVYVGFVTYNDGFPKTPTQPSYFCVDASENIDTKEIFYGYCDVAVVLKAAELADRYPQNEEK